MTAKQQCNVYLPPELVRDIKPRTIDEGLSRAALEEKALTEYLDRAPKEDR